MGSSIAEFAIHAWDVAVATGRRLDVPESLAKTMLDPYAREAPRIRSLGLLVDEVPQDAHAPLFERTPALSGRIPGWRSRRAGGGTELKCPREGDGCGNFLLQLAGCGTTLAPFAQPVPRMRGQAPYLLVLAPSSASACDRSPDLAVPLSVAPSRITPSALTSDVPWAST